MGLIATFTFGKSTCLICDNTLHNQVCGIHNVLHTSLLMEVTKLRRRISLCWSLFTNAILKSNYNVDGECISAKALPHLLSTWRPYDWSSQAN